MKHFYSWTFLFILKCIVDIYSGRKIKVNYEVASYKYPRNNNSSSIYETIAIMGINDIHGAAYGSLKKYGDEEYEVGGYKYLTRIIQILKREYDKNFLWFDAGDQFTGTYENILTKGELIKDFYKLMKPHGKALGNHEWDKGEEWLRKAMNDEKGKFVLANLTPKNGIEQLPNVVPTKMFSFPSGIKIGVIGLTTNETYFTTSKPPNNFVIKDYVTTIKEHSKKLKEEGANAVLLLCHIGAICQRDSEDEFKQLKLRTQSDKQGTCTGGELPSILNELNNNELDGVIAGHVHDTVHHWINGIPIIQNPISGVFTNVLYLRFKKQNKKLNKAKTAIEGPIPICSKIYEHNKRCDAYEVVKGKKLINYSFHSEMMKPSSLVQKIFKESFDTDVTKTRKEIVAQSTMNLKRDQTKDNILGNMICDIIRDFMKTDFCFLNYGSIRASWDIGSISYYDVLQMFPFPDIPAKINVNGETLKKIIKTLQEGVKGYYSNSGLVIEVQEKNNVKTFLSAKTTSGEELDNKKIYTVSSNAFLLEGGDDWSLVKKFFIPEANDYTKSTELTSKVIEDWLKKTKIIPPEDVKKSPRLIIKS